MINVLIFNWNISVLSLSCKYIMRVKNFTNSTALTVFNLLKKPITWSIYEEKKSVYKVSQLARTY